jgi:protein-S-isoprenylcysteine O-methyltransferase Ste14
MASLPLVAKAAGVLLSVTGAAVCIYWYVFWGRNYEGELITYGPYTYVRHPFYSGFLSLAVGLAVALPIYETRLLLVFTLAVIVVYVPKEEESLVQQYKKEYLDYMEKVRHKLIPGVY